jgi:hypothetical protein
MTSSTAARVARPVAAVVAPAGFLGVYLAVSPISDTLADRPMPLPTATAAETAAYFAANPLAVTAAALLQVVSVACFAVFVAAVGPLLRDTGRGAALQLVGYTSVAAMVASSLAAGAAAVAAPSASAETVDVLRQASFYAGGVANVVTLGAFVFGAALLLGRRGLLGRPTRVLGYVAGALAVLSVLSVGIYYATILLPVGRLLSMLWTVVAGIRLARAR